MARGHEIDREQVLAVATERFRARGYEGTSMRDLFRLAEVSPNSLYSAFGDKRHLFLSALDHYTSEASGAGWRALADPERGLAAVREHFERLVECFPEREGDVYHGCLMGNTATQGELVGEEARRRVRAFFAELEQRLRRCLEAAAGRGELREPWRPGPCARYLVTLVQGLTVTAQTGASRQAVRELVDPALRSLGA